METIKSAWAWVAQAVSDLHSSAVILIGEYPAIALWVWLSVTATIVFLMWG